MALLSIYSVSVYQYCLFHWKECEFGVIITLSYKNHIHIIFYIFDFRFSRFNFTFSFFFCLFHHLKPFNLVDISAILPDFYVWPAYANTSLKTALNGNYTIDRHMAFLLDFRYDFVEYAF